jgi:CRP/FNR family transcriptional regulator
MPSAQEIQTDDEGPAAMRTDLRSLLQAIHSFNSSSLSLLHPRGKVLFAEGEPARGVFILRTGRATVSISSSEGRLVILRIAQPGAVLGLNSALRNTAYNTTVKIIEPGRTDFIPRKQLVELLQTNQPASHAVSQILSREVAELTERARSLLLLQTANAKLARLLLDWSEESGATLQIARTFTQEEIAQMICSSRETVTRLLADLNRRRIIRTTTDSIVISDRAALQKLATG